MQIVLLSALLLCASSLMTKERLGAQMLQSGNLDRVRVLSDEWFDDIDVDRSQLLSRDELSDMNFLLVSGAEEGNFNDNFNSYDYDQSGDLSRVEFFAAFRVFYEWQMSDF
jgi:Ca2+-binding EF-hand superfamily protein